MFSDMEMNQNILEHFEHFLSLSKIFSRISNDFSHSLIMSVEEICS